MLTCTDIVVARTNDRVYRRRIVGQPQFLVQSFDFTVQRNIDNRRDRRVKILIISQLLVGNSTNIRELQVLRKVDIGTAGKTDNNCCPISRAGPASIPRRERCH